MFQPVSNQADFPAQERDVLDFWKRTGAFNKLRELRSSSDKRFSFIDGPITANNPMGVHHAWGRTYKDMWQRYKAMQGFNERWQNGFDCQGLWVEVNVEKALNLKSKRDIEAMGMEKFIRLCKERVLSSAAQMTEQSIRLGYWMDWNSPEELRDLAQKLVEDPSQHITLERDGAQVHGTVEQLIGQLGLPQLGGSYFTFSDENNYQIWSFLKKCHEKGWVYRGSDVIPWCPRCATGISQHEMDTEGYKDREDPAFTVRMKLTAIDHAPVTEAALNKSINAGQLSAVEWASNEARQAFLTTTNKYILAWTTTPWTLAANVMCAVGPKLSYAIVKQTHKDGEQAIYVLSAHTLKQLRGDHEQLGTMPGTALQGWTYAGLFDDLPAWIDAQKTWQDKHGFEDDRAYAHSVILWDEVGEAEGTGIVHNAPGCGPEDYKLGVEHGTPFVAPLDENGNYMDGYGPLTGKYGHDVPDMIEQLLKAKGFFYKREKYLHRYAHCWRCGTPLLYRQVDEWYISMDELRHSMMAVTEKINWIPSFGKERELDWLHNMHDWMISKKRYWGLALPIWEYPDGTFEVIGSQAELKARAVEGWDTFDGHTPHRPYIDAVKIKHPVTGLIGTRVPDVGNPWLDAGIVAFSTMRYGSDPAYHAEWFPADFMVESFPGQFRNWFYAMIAMSATVAEEMPAKTILGFATLFDEKGKPMHKSSGNSIEFNEAAEKAGADTMRWAYARQRYDDNMLFGWKYLDEVRRSVLIPLWNVYSFFVTYANADKWQISDRAGAQDLSSLDKWILTRLAETVNTSVDALDAFESRTAALSIEKFIDDLSTWYVRRSRERFWREGMDADKRAAYSTLHEVLSTLCKLMAPFAPFITEVMWANLHNDSAVAIMTTATATGAAGFSVHHQDYPAKRSLSADEQQLLRETAVARTVVNLGHSVRGQSKVKVRQPLARVLVVAPQADHAAILSQCTIITDELNVKALEFVADERELVSYKVLPDLKKLGKKLGQSLPAVRDGLAAMDPMTVAAAVKGNRAIEVAGATLQPDEVIVQAIPREGLVVAGEAGIVVALDTALTLELKHEGKARDIVRFINDKRKKQGLDVSDRIAVRYTINSSLPAAEGLAQTLALFGDYIQRETLASSLEAAAQMDASQNAENLDLDSGEVLTVNLRKV